MKKYCLLFFIVSIFSHISYGEKLYVQEKKIVGYSVSKEYDSETGMGKLTIKKDSQILHAEEGPDYHFYFGLEFDKEDTLSGKNITGNKIPNLIVKNWTGGTCCSILYIFELGKKFRKIFELELIRSGVDLVNLDEDKELEIEFGESAILGYFASSAGSPPGRVILKYKNNGYVLAPHLMKKPKPNLKKIKKIKSQIVEEFKKQDTPDLPYVFLETLMDLSYSGHLELALKIANETWPLHKPGFEEFKKTFLNCLNKSMYWKEFSLALKNKISR